MHGNFEWTKKIIESNSIPMEKYQMAIVGAMAGKHYDILSFLVNLHMFTPRSEEIYYFPKYNLLEICITLDDLHAFKILLKSAAFPLIDVFRLVRVSGTKWFETMSECTELFKSRCSNIPNFLSDVEFDLVIQEMTNVAANSEAASLNFLRILCSAGIYKKVQEMLDSFEWDDDVLGSLLTEISFYEHRRSNSETSLFKTIEAIFKKLKGRVPSQYVNKILFAATSNENPKWMIYLLKHEKVVLNAACLQEFLLSLAEADRSEHLKEFFDCAIVIEDENESTFSVRDALVKLLDSPGITSFPTCLHVILIYACERFEQWLLRRMMKAFPKFDFSQNYNQALRILLRKDELWNGMIDDLLENQSFGSISLRDEVIEIANENGRAHFLDKLLVLEVN